MNNVFLVHKKFDSWSKKCHFRSISGSFPMKLPSKNFFLEKFYCTKRFVFEFQGESLGLFLSHRAHFRRYQHFRGFWQSTASSFRDCYDMKQVNCNFLKFSSFEGNRINYTRMAFQIDNCD